MNRMMYRKIKNYMPYQMGDSAHDTEHMYYRVLHSTQDIARHEKDVDLDILIAACLLHDIRRKE